MSRSLLHPRSRNTPKGGRRMAMMILQMSLILSDQQVSPPKRRATEIEAVQSDHERVHHDGRSKLTMR